MNNESKVTAWLKKDHPELSWKRTEGDSPATKIDSLYINRSEGYEIRDLIISYYNKNNLEYKDSNFEITFNKVMDYKKGVKVKRDDMLEHLINSSKK